MYIKKPVNAIQIPFAFNMKIKNGRDKPFPENCWLIENETQEGKKTQHVLKDEEFRSLYGEMKS